MNTEPPINQKMALLLAVLLILAGFPMFFRVNGVPFGMLCYLTAGICLAAIFTQPLRRFENFIFSIGQFISLGWLKLVDSLYRKLGFSSSTYGDSPINRY